MNGAHHHHHRYHTTFYTLGRIFTAIAGLLAIIFAIFGIISGVIDFANTGFLNWFLEGFRGLVWFIIAIVGRILCLYIGGGYGLYNVNGIILGVIVIIIGIFLPGVATILAIIGGVSFIIDGIA
ncbi:MAG: hypothetical protein GF308_08290 [Candidatus Heimdallarchaeota archaeon]|nr:hypothetical protein [Candidatus Heimdallarchaeota archaeon]